MSNKKSKSLQKNVTIDNALSRVTPVDEADLSQQFTSLLFAAERLLPLFLISKGAENPSKSQNAGFEAECLRNLEKLLRLQQRFDEQAHRPDSVDSTQSVNAAALSYGVQEVSVVQDAFGWQQVQELNSQQREVLSALSQGCPLANDKIAADFLNQRRKEILCSFDSNVPPELREWACGWERKFNETVGVEYLRWLIDASRYLEKLGTDWTSEVSKQRKLETSLEFSLFRKLRTLRLANNERKLRSSCARIKRSNDRTMAVLRKKYSLLHYNCAVIGAMFKTISVNAGQNAKALYKLLALEVESKLQESMWQESRVREAAFIRESTALQQRLERTKKLRKYLIDIESKKNKSALQLYTSSQENVTQLITQATIGRVSYSFFELSQMLQAKRVEIANQKATIQKLRAELLQLRDLVEDYSEKWFPFGMPQAGSLAGWNDGKDRSSSHGNGTRAVSQSGIGPVSLREFEAAQRAGSQGASPVSMGASGAFSKLARQKLI